VDEQFLIIGGARFLKTVKVFYDLLSNIRPVFKNWARPIFINRAKGKFGKKNKNVWCPQKMKRWE
jgi:hypothetical protein